MPSRLHLYLCVPNCISILPPSISHSNCTYINKKLDLLYTLQCTGIMLGDLICAECLLSRVEGTKPPKNLAYVCRRVEIHKTIFKNIRIHIVFGAKRETLDTFVYYCADNIFVFNLHVCICMFTFICMCMCMRMPMSICVCMLMRVCMCSVCE